ncbi:MAG: 23S rRNA (adenine(2503)-C(2))-methyltransferase RlmN [Flavobacteriales bacterium]|nr:23S rRNA (adenine(2503)-C(2))-methyltransferase RlmN [Flavobacteriales bacterium]
MMPEQRQDIRKLSLEEIKTYFVGIDEKPFRAKQVHEWLWKKSAGAIDDMTNLSIPIREQLNKDFLIRQMTIAESQVSKDGTVKNAFKLFDGNIIEGVLIPTPKRITACVSSQVGCSLTCKFCGTGRLKRERNLDASEIYDQVVAINKQAIQNHNIPLSNIVYMGMGEPLLNYKNVLQSIDYVTSPEGLDMSPKRITVSTAGIAKMIEKLGDDEVKFNLALSLHAANDKKRDYIMPINEQNSLGALGKSLVYFHEKTDIRPTFEYIIFKGFNDKIEDAQELVEFCKQVPCKINIIEYNPIDDGELQQAAPKKVDDFATYLESKNLVVNVRRSRGKDIDAACGQLANKNEAILK